MSTYFVTDDGGLTTLGYVACILLAILALAIAVFFSRKKQEKTSKLASSPAKLAFCAMGLALSFALSYIKVIPMPFGGSVTLCSMLFVSMIGYWYGLGTGLLIAFTYGIMQFLQGPYILSFFQVCCDYLLAFTCLGLTGFFKDKKNGLTIGYLVSVIARAGFHSLGGYLYWMEYMPENFPKALSWAYPIVYNFSFILTEALITIIIINVPAVKKAINRVGALVNTNR